MKFNFTLKRNSSFDEFHREGILIHFFNKTAPKDFMYFHRSTYDVV